MHNTCALLQPDNAFVFELFFFLSFLLCFIRFLLLLLLLIEWEKKKNKITVRVCVTCWNGDPSRTQTTAATAAAALAKCTSHKWTGLCSILFVSYFKHNYCIISVKYHCNLGQCSWSCLVVFFFAFVSLFTCSFLLKFCDEILLGYFYFWIFISVEINTIFGCFFYATQMITKAFRMEISNTIPNLYIECVIHRNNFFCFVACLFIFMCVLFFEWNVLCCCFEKVRTVDHCDSIGGWTTLSTHKIESIRSGDETFIRSSLFIASQSIFEMARTHKHPHPWALGERANQF